MFPDYPFEPFLEALGDDHFADDPDLQTLMRHRGLSDPVHWKRLSTYGHFVGSSAKEAANLVDRPDTLPRLTPWDDHGREHPMGVEVHPATKRILAATLRAGAAFEPNTLLRYGMGYLASQVGEAGSMCATACTDGLVRSLQQLEGGPEAQAALDHILTQAPGGPVHGAQFVTEVQGGSDAGTNATEAQPNGDGSWTLTGKKWFCSNLWAQYWAVTARPVDAPKGSRGVALFLVPRTLEGRPNGFRVDRLKDKLGTRALPTAEVTLTGARAWPLGPLDAGLANMVGIVLSTSRFWCTIAAAGMIRSAERVVHAYASFRSAFGQPIANFPLVAQTLDDLTRDRRQHLAAALEVLAAWEDPAPEAQMRGRILVQLAKTVGTARATKRIHEGIMVLAGNGIEERFSPLPRLLRDAIILETWEGPHGLLLARSMLDLRRAGAADDAVAATQSLFGTLQGPVDALGARLHGILHDGDERCAAVAFRDWAADFYDALGAAAAADAGI